jgi:SM-20-related protein
MKNLFTDALGAALRDKGYAILDDALPLPLATTLLQTSLAQLEYKSQAAGVGRLADRTLNAAVRGDHICWLTTTEPASASYLALMEQTRLALNAVLFLGLFSYEAHYACYPAGAFYQKHRDAFKGSRNRILSTVYYLNRDWPGQAGGELVLYANDEGTRLETVQPQFNRMVVFLSEEFPHEVLPALQSRYSIAGWFRGLP